MKWYNKLLDNSVKPDYNKSIDIQFDITALIMAKIVLLQLIKIILIHGS